MSAVGPAGQLPLSALSPLQPQGGFIEQQSQYIQNYIQTTLTDKLRQIGYTDIQFKSEYTNQELKIYITVNGQDKGHIYYREMDFNRQNPTHPTLTPEELLYRSLNLDLTVVLAKVLYQLQPKKYPTWAPFPSIKTSYESSGEIHYYHLAAKVEDLCEFKDDSCVVFGKEFDDWIASCDAQKMAHSRGLGHQQYITRGDARGSLPELDGLTEENEARMTASMQTKRVEQEPERPPVSLTDFQIPRPKT